MKDFKSAQVKQAQENIYHEVLKQLNEAKLEEELVGRRMKHKK